MTKDQQIKEELRKMMAVGEKVALFNAKVISVEGDTCTIQLPSKLELSGVKLRAGVANEDGLVAEPKANSLVLIADLQGNLNSLTVVQAEEVAKFRYKQSGLEFLFDSTDKKVQIKNDQTSLADLFQGVVDILTTFAVTTSSGPSGTALPTSLAKIEAWKVKFKQLLK